MAHKKLKLEVELDTAKAKSQVKGLAAEGGASVATSTPKAADELAKSLDRASKSVADFGDKSKASAGQIAGVVRSFAGLGVGMALAYAGKNMERGSARTAVETAGGAVQGASMASAALMAIPGAAQLKAIGMLAGAAIGGGKVLFDKKGENDAYAKDFAKSEREYAASREWAEHFKNLTGAGKIDMGADELAATVEKITAAIGQLNHEEKERILTINNAIKAGELDAATREREELATARSKRAQLEAIRDNYNKQIEIEKKKKDEAKDFRAGTGGTDSLQKIGLDGKFVTDVTLAASAVAATRAVSRGGGVGFGFNVPTHTYAETKFGNFEKPNNDSRIITPLESAARNGQQQLRTLEQIAEELRKLEGGTSWQ